VDNLILEKNVVNNFQDFNDMQNYSSNLQYIPTQPLQTYSPQYMYGGQQQVSYNSQTMDYSSGLNIASNSF